MKTGRAKVAARPATPQKIAAAPALAAGCGLGFALGFAAFALRVALAGGNYFIGAPKQQSLAYAAAEAAGLVWLICTAAGLAAGLLAAFASRAAPSLAVWLRRASFAASGLYLLSLRGAWGPPPDVADAEAGAVKVLPAAAAALPAASVVVPLALGLAAAVVLLVVYLRAEKREDATAASAPSWAMHALFSLGAAHLTVQLPYLVSRTPGFFRGLPVVLRALFGG